MIFDCLRISSSREEDKIIIPVKGTVRTDMSVDKEMLYLDVIYKNIFCNEWMMLKYKVSLFSKFSEFQ